MKSFAETLNKLIKEKRLNTKQVAENTGIPRTTLNEWLLGRSPQLCPELVSLAKFLGVSMDYLFTGQAVNHDLIKNVLEKTEIHSGRYEITIKKLVD